MRSIEIKSSAMLGNAAICHLSISLGQSAKGDEELGMVNNVLQCRLLQLHLWPGRYNVGKNYLSGRRAVGIHSARASAH